jgi:oligosaccharyltransferase complex subunit beta
VFFSGVPHALGQNPQLVPILRAPSESFASEVDEGAGDKNADAVVDAAERGGEGLWAGSLMGVVSGFQTKNGARVVFAGGVDMFSDEFAEKEVSE